jgi:hypothetical protein
MPCPAVFSVPFLHLRIGKLNPFNIFRNHLNYTVNKHLIADTFRVIPTLSFSAAEKGAPSFVCYLSIFTTSLR